VADGERIVIKTPTGATLSSVKAGTGRSLLLLHRSIGGDSLSMLTSALTSSFSVVAPSMPGYDDSERPDWARSPRDLAPILLHALGELTDERPVLVGLGLGGWVAAEMAAMCSERLRALVLVSPLGVQPRVGEITDPFLVSTERYVELGFAKSEDYQRAFEEYELGAEPWVRRERNREMTTRIAWRPRMFDATLPFRLAYVTTPTLILWGEQDRILPRGGVDRYKDSIPGADLITLPDSGHMLDCEAPTKVRDLISSFAAQHA
jgi:pimeloyl-ACP methyl ester carboxylesterase